MLSVFLSSVLHEFLVMARSIKVIPDHVHTACSGPSLGIEDEAVNKIASKRSSRGRSFVAFLDQEGWKILNATGWPSADSIHDFIDEVVDMLVTGELVEFDILKQLCFGNCCISWMQGCKLILLKPASKESNSGVAVSPKGSGN